MLGLPVQPGLDTVEPFAQFTRKVVDPGSSCIGLDQTVFVGVHIDRAIITNGMIDMAKFQPVARLGYMDHTTVDNVFTMLRPGMDGSSNKSNDISAPPMPAYRSKADARPKFAVRLQMTRCGHWQCSFALVYTGPAQFLNLCD